MKKLTREEKLEKVESLRRFINTVGSGEKPDTEDRQAALAVCAAEMRKLKGGRPARKRYPTDTPQFAVALHYVEGSINYDSAVSQLCELCACEKRTAEKHLKDMKPRAKSTYAFKMRDS